MQGQDQLLPLVTAVEQATGLRPHLSTCLRWCTRGSKGIRLESWIVGGRRYTTVPAVRKYRDAVTSAAERSRIASRQQATPAQCDRLAERAAKKLAKVLGSSKQ